jgi:transformation/transcription domain-associated protein
MFAAARWCPPPVSLSTDTPLDSQVHHVRGELGIKHLSRVVHIFSCHVHDVSLPLAIQITSVRLLLNLVESIFHKNDVEVRSNRSLVLNRLAT